MPSELNRIYQGRVNQVFLEEENGVPVEFQNGDALLLQHHEVFQDAVNYYTVALAAMSSNSSLLGSLRNRLSSVWEDFYREGVKRPGLKHSIIRSLSADYPDKTKELREKTGLDLAMKLIVGSGEVPQEILNAALDLVVSKCEGDVVQPGRTYFARLCNSTYVGNWDFDKKALGETDGKHRLMHALLSDDPVAAVRAIVPEMTLGWSGVKTQDGKFFEGEEAKTALKDAIGFFLNETSEKLGPRVAAYLNERGKDELERYLKQTDKLEGISFDRNNKAVPSLKNAAWLLKFFPSDYTVGLFKAIFTEKKIRQEANVVSDDSIPNCGDDPVKLSRGSRGFAFLRFTALGIWNPDIASKDEPGWRTRFDQAAFCESLKTLNQFRQKTRERKEKLDKYVQAVEWMEGKSTATKAPPDPESDLDEDSDSAHDLPVLGGDPRWTALQKLLKEDLSIDSDLTEGELVDYGLTNRTIRGYNELRRDLLKLDREFQKKNMDDAAISDELLRKVTEFQSNHQETIGSADLFRKLTEPQYFCIWRESQFPGKYSSGNILQDAVKYYEYLEEKQRLQEPIMVTPADERYSRRTSDLRALVYDKNGYKKGFGHLKENMFASQIVRHTDKGLSSVKVRISYSAPRLKRDGLIGVDGSVYASPVLRALLGDESFPEQDFKSTSVSLMPDWDRKDKLRILLNFPVKLDVSKITNEAAARFSNQFIRQKNNSDWINSGLMWQQQNGKPVTWHQSGQPFVFVSADLGQRAAAAISRIIVSPRSDQPHAVPVGEIDGSTWYAARKYSALLRLPGEDMQVIRGGKRVQEYSGSEGRPATKEETADALDICEKLIGSTSFVCQYDNVTPIASFPEQNDRLLLALRRGIWRLKQLGRWGRMLDDPTKRENAEEELATSEWIAGDMRTRGALLKLEQERRTALQTLLLRISDRILPLRGRKWEWAKISETNSYQLRQTQPGSDNPRKRICGQRGLSMARIEQLDNLRKRCQALNRILMQEPGAEQLTRNQLRELQIPDCCPDILMRMNEMKEQRVNQTANMILAQALGLRLRPHEQDASVRAENGIHGEYECIPGVPPASFIVLENLSRYRFSQDRAAFENSRLMKWSHRQILTKLKLLCEVFNIPVLEVDAAYSSKFSASGFPGFRAEECTMPELNRIAAGRQYQQGSPKVLLAAIRRQLEAMQAKSDRATVLVPRAGGPIFVPFVPAENSDVLMQADVNASFNIGLRGVASPGNLRVNNRISAARAKKDSAEWVPKSKKLGKKYAVHYNPGIELDGNGGSFFIIPCSPDIILDQNMPGAHPEFVDLGLKDRYPHLLFGTGIWRNLTHQLERCWKINQTRLDKMNRSKEKS